MVARFLVSRTARRGHRSITSALHAAAASRRAALVEIEPGHYQETLTIRGEVELAVVGSPGSVIVSQSQGSVVDAFGTVRLSGLVLVGRDGDTVSCHGGTLAIEHAQIQGHSGVSVHAKAGTSVTLRDSVVRNGRTLFAGSAGFVERCRFTDAADNALAVIEGADVGIRDSWVGNSRIHGIRVSGARARITGCELTGTGNSAIMADTRAEVTVADCRITAVHSTAISFIEQSRGSVENTRVTDAEHGIAVLSGADPLVQRCVFTECRDSGINVHTQGLGRFENCEVVRAGSVAVFSTTGGSPDVRSCRISGGNVGIAVVNARGSFSQIEIHDLTSVALRLLENATGKFSHIRVARCPSGLETRGGGDTKAELTDANFRDFTQTAVTAIGQSRVTLRNSTAEHGLIGFGVGENAHLLVYDCHVKDVEIGGAVAFGQANLTAKNLTVTGSQGFGLGGQDSAYLDVANSEFIDTTTAGVSLHDSCGGQLVHCSVTGTQGVAVLDNGRVHLSSLRSSLPVIKQTPKSASDISDRTNNNFYGPVFHAAAEGLQLAWNNDTVTQEQTAGPFYDVGVGIPGWRAGFQKLQGKLQERIPIGSPTSAVHRVGPGVVQSIRGKPPAHDWVLCALPDQPPVAVADPIWEALHIAGSGVPDGDVLNALGFPAIPADTGPSDRVIDNQAEAVELRGGNWGDGRLMRSGDGWSWEPVSHFSLDTTRAARNWTADPRPPHLRVRALARLPWAWRERGEVTTARSREFAETLSVGELTELFTVLSRRRGADLPAARWTPGPHRNTLDAFSYSTTLTTTDLRPALSGEVLLALPNSHESAIVTCAELRIEDATAWADAVREGNGKLQLSWEELFRFFTVAWRTATEVLPSLISPDPRALRWAAPPTVELRLSAEPEHGTSGAPRPLDNLVDFSPLGDRIGEPLSEMAVTITAPLQMSPEARETQTRQAIIHMIRAFGFLDATEARIDLHNHVS